MGSIHPYGIEWLVDARGCSPAKLQSLSTLRQLFTVIVRDLDLHPIGEIAWHRFPGTRGLTGFWLLKESHLACHTFPEFGSICIDLFCCRPRAEWPWRERLQFILGATDLDVRSFRREYSPVEVAAR